MQNSLPSVEHGRRTDTNADLGVVTARRETRLMVAAAPDGRYVLTAARSLDRRTASLTENFMRDGAPRGRVRRREHQARA